MKKYFLFFAIFLSFFYLFQNADALDYKCDSVPNGYLSPCPECASACDYSIYKGVSGCAFSDCPAGSVLVDCPTKSGGNYAECMNLQCGNAGTPSGNTCVQDSSLDSDCVTTIFGYTYGWTDNTAPLSCTCYDLGSMATRSQFTKKDNGAICTYKDGTQSKCESGICKPPTSCISCLDGTLVGECNAVGERCMPGCIFGNDPPCPSCTATLTLNPGASGGSCPITATVAATGCDGKAFQVKEGGTVKCSGTISGTSGTCTSTISPPDSVAHNYDLYVDGVSKDTGNSAKCEGGSGTPSCSGKLHDPCIDDTNCDWCPGSNTCVMWNENCAINNPCPAQTTKSACDNAGDSYSDYDCAWCPNSYSGKTSAYGGECMKAMDLAAQCGGCYVANTYDNYYSFQQYCFGKCPEDSAYNGYYGGWCYSGAIGTICDTQTLKNPCNCAGNTFNTAKSTNDAVDCGECAKDCGGTAVNGVYTDTVLGYIYYYQDGTVRHYAKYLNDPKPNTGVRQCNGPFEMCSTSEAGCKQTVLDACNKYFPGSNYADAYFSSESSALLCNSFWSGGTAWRCLTRAGGNYEGKFDSNECSDGSDNDRDCLKNCDDLDCSATAACRGITAKQSCNGGNCYWCDSLHMPASTAPITPPFATCDEMDMPFMRY